ncbi:MAG: RICIN domain-containing protein, partial [Mucilaginibacter sp.]
MMKNFKSCNIILSCMLVLVLSCKKSEGIKKPEVKTVTGKSLGVLATAEEIAYRGQLASAIESGRVMEIAGLSSEDGALAQQWEWLSLNSQKWTAQRISDSYFKIINIGSKKVLTSPGNTAGAQLQQSEYTGSDSQLWRIISAGPGQLYRVVNKNGLAVSLNAPGDGNGAAITQEATGAGASQLWFIQRLFSNPLKAAVADPWVTQRNGTYYFTATTGWNITIYKTKNMSQLKSAP